MIPSRRTVLDVYGKSANNVYIKFMEAYVTSIEPESREAYAALFSQLALQSGTKILEVGVGTGRNLHRYPTGVSFVGLDLTPEMLEVAIKKAKEIRMNDAQFINQDAVDLPFEDNSFDAVISTYTLCVTEYPQKVMDEMVRVCKPEGHIGLYDCRKASDKHILKSQEFLADTISTIGLLFEGQSAVVYNILSDLDGLVANTGLKKIDQRIMEFGPIECLGMYVLQK